MCPVSDIARASGRKPEEVERDLLDMEMCIRDRWEERREHKKDERPH